MRGFFEFLCHAAPQDMFDGPDTHTAKARGLFAGAQMLRLVDLIIEAVQHEIQQIRHHGLRSLAFQKFYQVIVARRGEFYQYLAYNAHSGLLDVQQRNRVELPDDIPAHSAESKEVHMLCGHEILGFLHPFSVQGVH